MGEHDMPRYYLCPSVHAPLAPHRVYTKSPLLCAKRNTVLILLITISSFAFKYLNPKKWYWYNQKEYCYFPQKIGMTFVL